MLPSHQHWRVPAEGQYLDEAQNVWMSLPALSWASFGASPDDIRTEIQTLNATGRRVARAQRAGLAWGST